MLRRPRCRNAAPSSEPCFPWPRLACGVAMAFLGSAAACGLAQGGLSDTAGDDGGMDATAAPDGSLLRDGGATPDGSGTAETSSDAAAAGEDGGVPPACTTLDASCLGTVPAGWQPVAVSDAGCGTGFTADPLLVNPQLPDGGCACGACQVVGAFACNAVVAASGGDNCADPTLVTLTSGTCAAASAQHIEAHPPQATGSVSCFAANDAGSGAIADGLTLCVPGCSADYCAPGPHCIVADGDLACPAGFTPLAKAGTGVDPGCAPCTCDAGGPGLCDGTITAYDNATCTDSGAQQSYAVGTCNQYSTTSTYQSLLVQLVPPAGSCTSSTADDGDAGLTGIKTICCK